MAASTVATHSLRDSKTYHMYRIENFLCAKCKCALTAFEVPRQAQCLHNVCKSCYSLKEDFQCKHCQASVSKLETIICCQSQELPPSVSCLQYISKNGKPKVLDEKSQIICHNCRKAEAIALRIPTQQPTASQELQQQKEATLLCNDCVAIYAQDIVLNGDRIVGENNNQAYAYFLLSQSIICRDCSIVSMRSPAHNGHRKAMLISPSKNLDRAIDNGVSEIVRTLERDGSSLSDILAHVKANIADSCSAALMREESVHALIEENKKQILEKAIEMVKLEIDRYFEPKSRLARETFEKIRSKQKECEEVLSYQNVVYKTNDFAAAYRILGNSEQRALNLPVILANIRNLSAELSSSSLKAKALTPPMLLDEQMKHFLHNDISITDCFVKRSTSPSPAPMTVGGETSDVHGDMPACSEKISTTSEDKIRDSMALPPPLRKIIRPHSPSRDRTSSPENKERKIESLEDQRANCSAISDSAGKLPARPLEPKTTTGSSPSQAKGPGNSFPSVIKLVREQDSGNEPAKKRGRPRKDSSESKQPLENKKEKKTLGRRKKTSRSLRKKAGLARGLKTAAVFQATAPPPNFHVPTATEKLSGHQIVLFTEGNEKVMVKKEWAGEICTLCGLYDPPEGEHYLSRAADRTTAWTLCDTCPNWCHNACILREGRKRNLEYVKLGTGNVEGDIKEFKCHVCALKAEKLARAIAAKNSIRTNGSASNALASTL